MRILPLLLMTLITAGCSKTDGERCIDSYMEIFDRNNPDASSKRRDKVEMVITIQCTDPSFSR